MAEFPEKAPVCGGCNGAGPVKPGHRSCFNCRTSRVNLRRRFEGNLPMKLFRLPFVFAVPCPVRCWRPARRRGRARRKWCIFVADGLRYDSVTPETAPTMRSAQEATGVDFTNSHAHVPDADHGQRLGHRHRPLPRRHRQLRQRALCRLCRSRAGTARRSPCLGGRCVLKR